MSRSTEFDGRTTFARRRERKAVHTDEDLTEIVRELRRAGGGQLLRFRTAASHQYRLSYWATLQPDGPNVALSTLRMLEKRGYTKKLRRGLYAPGFETHLLTGKGL